MYIIKVLEMNHMMFFLLKKKKRKKTKEIKKEKYNKSLLSLEHYQLSTKLSTNMYTTYRPIYIHAKVYL